MGELDCEGDWKDFTFSLLKNPPLKFIHVRHDISNHSSNRYIISIHATATLMSYERVYKVIRIGFQKSPTSDKRLLLLRLTLSDQGSRRFVGLIQAYHHIPFLRSLISHLSTSHLTLPQSLCVLFVPSSILTLNAPQNVLPVSHPLLRHNRSPKQIRNYSTPSRCPQR